MRTLIGKSVAASVMSPWVLLLAMTPVIAVVQAPFHSLNLRGLLVLVVGQTGLLLAGFRPG